jgi:hypothetical protein
MGDAGESRLISGKPHSSCAGEIIAGALVFADRKAGRRCRKQGKQALQEFGISAIVETGGIVDCGGQVSVDAGI